MDMEKYRQLEDEIRKYRQIIEETRAALETAEQRLDEMMDSAAANRGDLYIEKQPDVEQTNRQVERNNGAERKNGGQ